MTRRAGGEADEIEEDSSNDMGATGLATNPTAKLRAALRDRTWSEEELAWVLDFPVELAEHLAWELHITPSLALRGSLRRRCRRPICGFWKS